jgi:thiol-disulfide isomerase/thioredoxin
LASEFAGVNVWLNCDGPLRLHTLYGNVVLLEFWSSGCSNCIRTLPFMIRMHTRYREHGLVVAGIHTSEFRHETTVRVVQATVAEHGIRYIVKAGRKVTPFRRSERHPSLDGLGAWSTRRADALAASTGAVEIVELGSGSATKTRLLLGALYTPTRSTSRSPL